MGGYPALAVQPPQDPSQGIERAITLRNLIQAAPLHQQILQQQAQAGELENQQRQQGIKDQQAATAAMREWDGKDMDALPGLVLKKGGSAQVVMGLKQTILKNKTDLANLSKDQLQNEKTKNDYFAQQVDNIKSLPQDQQPAAFEAAKAEAVQKGHLDPQQAQAMQYQGPQQLDLLEKSLKGHDAVIADALKQQQTKEAEAKTEEASAAAAKNRMEVEAGGTGAMADSRYRNIVMNEKLGRPVSPEDKAFKQAYVSQKSVVPQATINLQGGLLNDAAQQMAAQYYQQTGQLPAGMRSPAMAGKILNKAAGGAEIPNIATNKADYEANRKSLDNLQKNFDQVSAFENTATKNLDLFLDKLGKIPDLKVKFANTPMRMLDAKLIGSDNYQAMKAAQQTAASEVAKVLSSANASGILSDSQKKEAEDVLSGNLSYSAAQSVIQTLKQDFANRHSSYQNQLESIRGRMSGKSSTPPSTGGDFFSQFGGKAKGQ